VFIGLFFYRIYNFLKGGIYDLKIGVLIFLIQSFCFAFAFMGFMLQPEDLIFLWTFKYFIVLFEINAVLAVCETMLELSTLFKEKNKAREKAYTSKLYS
jgi:hypothetical protein